jgi:hypothetical protein
MYPASPVYTHPSGFVGQLPVPLHVGRRSNGDLASFALGQYRAVNSDNPDSDACHRPATGAQQLRPSGQGGLVIRPGHRQGASAGLGHTVVLDDFTVEYLDRPSQQRFTDGRGTIRNALESADVTLLDARHAVHDRLDHRRHHEYGGHVLALERIHDTLRIERAVQQHRTACQQRIGGGADPADMEQGCDYELA